MANQTQAQAQPFPEGQLCIDSLSCKRFICTPPTYRHTQGNNDHSRTSDVNERATKACREN